MSSNYVFTSETKRAGYGRGRLCMAAGVLVARRRHDDEISMAHCTHIATDSGRQTRAIEHYCTSRMTCVLRKQAWRRQFP